MKLFWKIYLLSFCSVLLCTVMLTAIVSYLEADESLARMRAEQRLLAETAASQVETGYYDQVWPFEMLARLTREPQFVAWHVVDGAGKVIMSSPASGGGLVPQVVYAAELVKLSDVEETWVIPMRMRDGPTPWQFRLGYHTRAIRAQLRAIIMTNALIGLGLAILFIGASVYVTHRVLRPLASLTTAVSELKDGRLDVELPRASNDELGQLVTGFSAMVESIKDRDTKIQSHLESLEAARAGLEMRVAIRTQELHASEQRTRAIIESAADAIVTLDGHGVIDVFNPAAARMFGRAQDEVVGMRFDALLPSQYAIRYDQLSIDSVESGVATAIGTAGEITALRRDGTEFPMHIALSEVSIDGNRLLTAIVRDISERKRAEAEKADLHARLVAASRQAGMAEVASNVLHNVGNVLNSVNVSASVIGERLVKSRMTALSKASALLQEHTHDLGDFVTKDERGKLLPMYLHKLSDGLLAERQGLLDELGSLTRDIEHIKQVVTTQQSYARVSLDVRELVDPRSIMEDALRISGAATGGTVAIVRDYAANRPVKLDRHKIVHVLVNLINNARQAVAKRAPGEIRLCCALADQAIRFEIADNGVGIASENLVRIFNHGFTTRPDGHGFGLHGAAVSAGEMGGSLVVHSDGVDLGACFSLTLPTAA